MSNAKWSKVHWSGWLFTAIGCVVMLLGGCDQATEVAEPPLRPVRILVVEGSSDGRARTFSGTSRSTQISRLSFKIGGNIVELPIEVGDQVSPGQLLARVDDSGFALQEQQAQAALVQAQASQRNAEANYSRVKSLYENNSTSRNELDSARANAESAVAQSRSAQKSLELARLNRSYARLTAERECKISSVSVDLNENITAGAEVARVNCGDGLEIEIPIPESLIADVQRDSPVDIRFSAIPDLEFSGTVSEVGVAGGTGSPTFPVIVSVDGAERRLRSGLAADVTFRFKSGNGGKMLVPAAAVFTQAGDRYVFVAETETEGVAIVSQRAVDIGELTSAGVEVVAGLSAGDKLITAGVSAIRDGQRVLLR